MTYSRPRFKNKNKQNKNKQKNQNKQKVKQLNKDFILFAERKAVTYIIKMKLMTKYCNIRSFKEFLSVNFQFNSLNFILHLHFSPSILISFQFNLSF